MICLSVSRSPHASATPSSVASISTRRACATSLKHSSPCTPRPTASPPPTSPLACAFSANKALLRTAPATLPTISKNSAANRSFSGSPTLAATAHSRPAFAQWPPSWCFATKPSNPCSLPLNLSTQPAAHTTPDPSTPTTVPYRLPCTASSTSSALPLEYRQFFCRASPLSAYRDHRGPDPSSSTSRDATGRGSSFPGTRRSHYVACHRSILCPTPYEVIAPFRQSRMRPRSRQKEIGFAPDSPPEGNGFEHSVPRKIGDGFVGSSELEPIYRRTGHPSSCRPRHTDRVVGRRSEESPLTARIRRRQTTAALSAVRAHRGTVDSNPLSSSRQSVSFRSLADSASSLVRPVRVRFTAPTTTPPSSSIQTDTGLRHITVQRKQPNPEE